MNVQHTALAALLMLGTGCGAGTSHVPVAASVASLEERPVTVRQPELAGERFSLCGSGRVELTEIEGGRAYFIGLAPPGTAVVGVARQGALTECDVETPLGNVRAWVPTDRLCGSIARDSSLSASQAPIPMEPNSDTATGATPAERARALLPTGVPEFAEFMRVVPGAPFIAKGGSVLVTPEDAFALVGALWPDDTHDVFIATRSGFLFLGRLRRDALQRYSAP